jgi:pimeloyl-ACP methyl ester carboxylesterase
MAEVQAGDGIALYVERHGARKPGAYTILFSCPYSTTHANWLGQVEPMVAAGHSVLLWDFRGHGRSGVPSSEAGYSLDHVLDDMGRVLDWGAPDEAVVLAGLSFGGLASLHFAHRHPTRVAALVLANSGPGFKNPEAAADWKARSVRTADFIEARGFEAFVTGKAAPTCIGRQPELPVAKAAAEAIKAQDPAGVANFGRYVAGLAPSIIDELAEIEIPALVAVGGEDHAYQRAAEVMASKLPRARYEVVEGAGHIVNIEAAAEFNASMLDFLGGLDAAR